MPGTFSHPLAVVPLRRICPGPINFAALVIGSLSPDFGYYLRQFPLARFAHTIPGTLVVCLPSGLLAVGLFYFLRRPLCFILPQPHRSALMPLALREPAFSFTSVLIVALCVLVGAWTHTIWDSFTHTGGWSVEHFAVLRAPLIHVGGTKLPVSYVLQQVSTFAGGAFLAFLYFRWLRRQANPAAAEVESLSDRWRYGLLGLLVVTALASAIPSALRMASHYEGYLAFRVFVFRTGVYSAAAFIPLLVLASVALYAGQRNRA